MLFSVGFLVTFLLGGLTGALLALPAVDWHVTDTYFVVAHFHYVLFGTIVFATYAGIYFWFPKITGRMLDEPLGKFHFWATFIGFHLTFLVHHWLGARGMPRRYVDYLPSDGFTTLNMVSSIDAFVLGASVLPFLWNVFRSYRYGEVVTVDDPWGFGNSLEWANHLPATTAQLHRTAPDPLRATGLRTALPTHGRSDPHRSAHQRRRPPSRTLGDHRTYLPDGAGRRTRPRFSAALMARIVASQRHYPTTTRVISAAHRTANLDGVSEVAA
jgi:heme/copper-type cytochrome/quinol oxidase subunit 1